MEAATQGITIADAEQPDCPLIYANRGFQRITGYPVDEALGRNCRFLQGDNTSQETVAEIREALEAERPVSTDILNYRYDGTPFWNRLDVVPVEDEAGEVTHFLGFQRDVTEQKETEQQLSVLNRVLRHNLRNKMNVIHLYAEQLRELPEGAHTAESISEAASELLAISEQIRKFDSIIAPDERDLETLDLVDFVSTAVDALRHRNPDANIDLSAPDSATILAHGTLRPALTDLVTLSDSVESPALDIEITCEASAVAMSVVARGDEVSATDLAIVAGRGETQLEHLESLELWLIRWAVEESRGEFLVDTESDDPVLMLRFKRAGANT
jgi:PAS domain S-box-containing protein